MNETKTEIFSTDIPVVLRTRMQAIINSHLYSKEEFEDDSSKEERIRETGEYLMELSDFLHDPENARYEIQTVSVQSLHACVRKLFHCIPAEIRNEEQRVSLVKQFLERGIKVRIKYLAGTWEEIL